MGNCAFENEKEGFEASGEEALESFAGNAF